MNQLFHIIMEITGIALLSAPLLWELDNDKNGDSHLVGIGFGWTIESKTLDIVFRCGIALLVSWVNWFIGNNGFIQSLIMSGAIHFLLFDYIIVIILSKRQIITSSAKWYDYLGSKGMDTKEWWASKHWTIRMAIKIAVFIIACVIYF